MILRNPSESESKPGTIMVYPEPIKRIKKAAAIYGWDCPLLTFIYPGFGCGSSEKPFEKVPRFSTMILRNPLKSDRFSVLERVGHQLPTELSLSTVDLTNSKFRRRMHPGTGPPPNKMFGEKSSSMCPFCFREHQPSTNPRLMLEGEQKNVK